MPATQEAVEDARCVNEVELVLLYSFGLAISAAKLVCGRVMLFSRCSDVFFFPSCCRAIPYQEQDKVLKEQAEAGAKKDSFKN